MQLFNFIPDIFIYRLPFCPFSKRLMKVSFFPKATKEEQNHYHIQIGSGYLQPWTSSSWNFEKNNRKDIFSAKRKRIRQNSSNQCCHMKFWLVIMSWQHCQLNVILSLFVPFHLIKSFHKLWFVCLIFCQYFINN